MGLQGRLNVVLLFAGLSFFLPALATANEKPGWHGQRGTHGASLFYGIRNADQARLAFSCTRGSNELTFTFAFAPGNALEGAGVEVLLEAGGISVPIATTGARIAVDDRFILEGKTVLDARLADLLTSRGTLSVFVEDGSEEYPLDGAREAAAALIETCSGTVASVPASGTTQCELAAWVMKGAPADLAVRSGPGPDHAVLAIVPGPYTDGEETYFPQVTITGSRDGWFRISEIVTDLYGGLPTGPTTSFSGEGWLPGNVLRLWVESGRLWSRPSGDAPIAATFSSDGFKVDRLHACDGAWVEIEGNDAGRRLRGWTTDVCANQMTTCP